jgi:hypothetical protein
MEVGDRLPVELPTDRTGVTPTLALLVAGATLLGAAHHLDHVVRGNHVGWPLTPEVNPFTYSLAVYPLVAVGLYLTVTDRNPLGYWAGFLAVSTGMLTVLHLSPWAVEPPGDVILPYADPTVGYLAFGVLLALIATLALGTAYTALLWSRSRQ